MCIYIYIYIWPEIINHVFPELFHGNVHFGAEPSGIEFAWQLRVVMRDLDVELMDVWTFTLVCHCHDFD